MSDFSLHMSVVKTPKIICQLKRGSAFGDTTVRVHAGSDDVPRLVCVSRHDWELI